MPLQNRVTPEGEIIATPARGTMMGNRGGCLHRPDKTLTGRRWVSRQWICCELAFNGRHREVMAERRYTELFFLDEATALAAGHRPCFECRRADAIAFASLWAKAEGVEERPKADRMDRVLHAERLIPDGGKRTFRAALGDLPSGCMVRIAGRPHLLNERQLHAWAPQGYNRAEPVAPAQIVDVLTPPAIVALLQIGLKPRLHPSIA
jgi:hypothetical protein